MKEEFLHYVWKFQKFCTRELFTSSNKEIKILSVGTHNLNAGPDFFNSQISIDGQLWAGNIEIHVKSSHWYSHQHQIDSNYDNVVLHVVWEHDADIYRNDNSIIPTLEIKDLIEARTLDNYRMLIKNSNKWISCENDFPNISGLVYNNWLERLYFERLEKKSVLILNELSDTTNNWEELLFRLLCKNFGLKVNGEAFLDMARSIDFDVLQKCSHNLIDIESLLLGQADLLNDCSEDCYFDQLKRNYHYLKHKFKLDNSEIITPKFFRLRPPSFPTIRLSQLAMLYAKVPSLFSKIIAAKTKEEFYSLFKISASEYWNNHYNFGISSPKKPKILSKKFIDLLIINTILPLKFCYATFIGKDISEEIVALSQAISKEENSVIRKFEEIRPTVRNALQSQGLIQLKTNYCDQYKCINCAIGNYILKG